MPHLWAFLQERSHAPQRDAGCQSFACASRGKL